MQKNGLIRRRNFLAILGCVFSSACLSNLELLPRTGNNYVGLSHVCLNGRISDNPADIFRAMDYYYVETFGHHMIVALFGSVGPHAAPVAHALCPVCRNGEMINVIRQYYPFNPNDDNDDTPHSIDLGACNNRDCSFYQSHRFILGSLRPDTRGHQVHRVRGQRVVFLPDTLFSRFPQLNAQFNTTLVAPGVIQVAAPAVGMQIRFGFPNPLILAPAP
jgi:hypothetical protein